ncbi:MAG TPA: dihydrofolate reductase [Ktedonobacteraceae bacterium]
MISMIAAYARGRVIGKDNTVPWRVPDDARYFQQTTRGHIVVMGRKTFASIANKPLPQRRNIVLTSSSTFPHAGVEVFHSVEGVLALDTAENEEIFIIGGQHIYELFLDVAKRLYITEIELTVEGDTFFPAWKPQEFTLLSARPGQIDSEKTPAHTFFVYERIPAHQ